MDALHRLAGISSDTTDIQAHPPQPIVPEPARNPQDDTEAQASISRRTSRVSLPQNRPPSQKSTPSVRRVRSTGKGAESQRPNQPTSSPRSPQHGGPPTLGGHDLSTSPRAQNERIDTAGRETQDEGEGEQEVEDPFPWGPTHPCFPHPNPHVSTSDPRFKSTRVIRVRRDYLAAGDLCPQYANLYPEILDPLVRDDEFRALISGINSRLQVAFDPFRPRAWFDTFMGLVTGFLWEDAGFTGAKRGALAVEAFLDEWNKQRRMEGRDVKVVGLRRTGYLSLDFVVPDPGIDTAGHENEDGDGEVGDEGEAVRGFESAV